MNAPVQLEVVDTPKDTAILDEIITMMNTIRTTTIMEGKKELAASLVRFIELRRGDE